MRSQLLFGRLQNVPTQRGFFVCIQFRWFRNTDFESFPRPDIKKHYTQDSTSRKVLTVMNEQRS